MSELIANVIKTTTIQHTNGTQAAQIGSGGQFITNQIQTTAGKPILNSTGSILQVAYAESTTEVTTNAQTYVIIHSVTLTSVSPNSRYFMIGYSHAYSTSGYARTNLGFSVRINGVTTRIYGVDGIGDSWGTVANYPGTGGGAQLNRSGVYTSSAAAGTSLTFNLLGASYDSVSPTLAYFNISGYGHKSTITVMEISA